MPGTQRKQKMKWLTLIEDNYKKLLQAAKNDYDWCLRLYFSIQKLVLKLRIMNILVNYHLIDFFF